MKIALIHDWLNGMRGGEKVLEVFCDIFPDATLHTLFYEPDRVSEKIRRMNPRPSILQWFPLTRRHYRYYLPLFPWAVRRFNLSAYDAVISLSHCAAKGVRLRDNQPHICYCFTPIRYVWEQYNSYFGGPNSWRPSSLAMRFWRRRLREWDVATAKRVNAFITVSAAVAHRISRYYQREASVIHPPVDTDRFHPLAVDAEDHFLVVSALVPYKRIDLAIEAFNRMKRPLWIVGEGPERRALQRQAGPTVRFLGWVSDDELIQVYNTSKALIFPGEEDFGLTAVEAQACGRPVIAFRKGGVTESVLERRTGLFFREQTVESLCETVGHFERTVFDRGVIRAHAERFGGDRCRLQLQRTLFKILESYGIQTPPATAF